MPTQNPTSRKDDNRKDLHGTKRSTSLGSKSDPGFISEEEKSEPSKELRGTKSRTADTPRDDEDSVSQ